jgi:hypothetical protein
MCDKKECISLSGLRDRAARALRGVMVLKVTARTSEQCATFTGIGPEAESNHVTLRIKYGQIPKKLGISPDPAAESKVGYIPHLSGTQLSRLATFDRPAATPGT